MNTKLPFRSKISSRWLKLTGDPSVFPLEYRIFHALCIVMIIAMMITIPVNLIISEWVAAGLCVVAGCVFAFFLYRSRFGGKVRGSIFMTALICNALFFVNYFYNSGISGPNDVVFALSLYLIVFVTPKKQHKYWLGVNVILLLAMHLIEYYYPKLVPYTYLSRSDRFIDVTSAYMIGVLIMYFTIKNVRNNYDFERLQVEEKRKDIEQQHQFILAQNEQLEHINSEKNKLMSIIAHDLRGPLSNIQNYLELVGEYGLDKEEREVVESDLLRVTQSTLNMLSKLLIWSKSQMDGVVVKLSDMRLNETLKNTLEMERIMASKKDIELTYEVDPAINVVADSDMLQLVVRNIVSNAIKFTPAGGKVDVSTRLINNECRISIADNGRGIAYEQQGDMFTLKARSTFGTANEKGVGLGLILCKEFTEQQGGRISFESIPGHGSTFHIFMPLG
ncbi:sensor histidine kinase KdpD [Mucilaginibacter sp. BT774]|uniref:sensor histidine kinase n=1 Tax=Mucilaginibacter sp. BT774 TaxID=3062276 RepID=UPI002674AED9|nr:HAMP domain-containing sensor histidine kinase [Mucilaginibacter sp. BT774]MDO3624673.1 HAMP domain-containing sensor histidine kinase [Mucilaginibacter sp. BT774]